MADNVRNTTLTILSSILSSDDNIQEMSLSSNATFDSDYGSKFGQQLSHCSQTLTQIENFTDIQFPGEIKTEPFGADKYFKICLYIVAILASLFGNSAVVLAIYLKRTLRVTVNLYLANLAVADILICVCCMWVHLVNHLTTPAYVLGPLVCKVNAFAQMTSLTASVLTLSAIAGDRYMAIMFPLRSRVTKRRTGTVIAFIWFFSLLISTPFFIVRQFKVFQWANYVETNCMEIWPVKEIEHPIFNSADSASSLGFVNSCVDSHYYKRIYYTLVTTTLFFVPVLIMLFAYSAIIWKLWVSKMPGEAHHANIQAKKKSKRKVIQMVLTLLLVFVVCWLPLQIVVLYSIYGHSTADGVLPDWFQKMSYYASFIAYSNSAFNPLIYGGFNRNFRDALCDNSCCRALSLRNRSTSLRRTRYSSRTMLTVMTNVNGATGVAPIQAANSGALKNDFLNSSADGGVKNSRKTSGLAQNRRNQLSHDSQRQSKSAQHRRTNEPPEIYELISMNVAGNDLKQTSTPV